MPVVISWIAPITYVFGLLNPRDQLHIAARKWFPRVRIAEEIWITEAILLEVGDGFAAYNRSSAAEFIQQCYNIPSFHVVSVDKDLLGRALVFYKNRLDKTWGLTDCISFTVMKEKDIAEALTADQHFVQAGFRALLLE